MGLDYSLIQAQAVAVAEQMIAERAKVDLYYLCTSILGGEGVLDPKVHGPLCRALRPLLFHKDPDAITGIEFPSDYGRTDDEGMPTPEQKQEFLNWQAKFIPDSTTGVAEDKFNIRLNKLLALMPRGTLKSTVITIGFTIQWHLNFPDERVLLDSEVFGKSKAFLSEIKGHYEKGKKLRRVYGTIYKNEDGSPMMPDQNSKHDTWSTEAINLSCRQRPQKEPSIDCSGIGVTKNGMHYDLVLADDLHSEQNTKDKDQIDKAKQHFKLLYSLLEPASSMAVIGTRWDDDDLYQMIIDERGEEFNFITRSAESSGGDLFYEKRLTRPVLLNFRDVLGPYLFSCQYQNNPVDEEDATFTKSMFKQISLLEYKAIPINEYGLVDPSYKGDHNSSDYAAFVIGGMGTRKEIYCRYAYKEKMIYSEIFNKMAELEDSGWFHVRFWLVEAIGTKSLEHDFQRMNDERFRAGKQMLKIRYNRSQPNAKLQRIAALSPHHERGDAYYVQGGGMIAELQSELTRYPKAKFDDLSDCYSGILRVGIPPRADLYDEKEVQKRERRNRINNKPRSPVTGY